MTNSAPRINFKKGIYNLSITDRRPDRQTDRQTNLLFSVLEGHSEANRCATVKKEVVSALKRKNGQNLKIECKCAFANAEIRLFEKNVFQIEQKKEEIFDVDRENT